MISKEKYDTYVGILKEELVPAMGCTEPVSIAYASAKAREILGEEPIKGQLLLSGNIVKNAKSITVPHTGGMTGLKVAFSAGVVAGNPNGGYQVLSDIKESDIEKIKKFNDNFNLEIKLCEDASIFDVRVYLESKNHTSFVRIENKHTDIVRIEKDGKEILSKESEKIKKKYDRSLLSVEDIVEFADTLKIEDVKETLDRQIKCNIEIANEGLKNKYGANVGKTYLTEIPDRIESKIKAYAAAASDARMNGCEMPVVINSGSGNQGITASVPVIVYAEYKKVEKEKLYRALALSNLITIHIKTGIGTLSAYCGAVAAGAGAGTGITYLEGGKYTEIAHTLVNALAIDSGIICDGAKASCAAKIATAVENGYLGYLMYKNGNQFYGGDGIVKSGVENTIKSVSRLANFGMRETDKEILKIMLEENN